MQNDLNNQEDIFEVEFDHSAREQLQAAATWAKTIAVLGFVSYAVSLLAAILGKQPSLTGGAESAPGTWDIVFTLISVTVGSAIAYFLFKFARKTSEGLQNNYQADLEAGFSGLRYYFKIQGIITILLVLVVVLAVIAISIR